MTVRAPSARGGSIVPARAGWARALFGTWKGRIAILVLVAMTVAGIAYQNASTPTVPGYRTVPVRRGDVTQTVSITGAVDPATDTRVTFKIPGRLAETLVSVGQTVTAG